MACSSTIDTIETEASFSSELLSKMQEKQASADIPPPSLLLCPQAQFLQVELPFHLTQDLIIDLSLIPQPDEGRTLHLNDLAVQPLMGGDGFLVERRVPSRCPRDLHVSSTPR
jgi:hypothetical protein